MAVVNVYAGSPLTQLPSPTEIKPTRELIWSENTGRAQSGSNQAKMIGDVVAEKRTFDITWGILTQAEFDTIVSKLTAGFFDFGIGTSPTVLGKFYRSNIMGTIIMAGSSHRYKEVTVSVIEQ